MGNNNYSREVNEFFSKSEEQREDEIADKYKGKYIVKQNYFEDSQSNNKLGSHRSFKPIKFGKGKHIKEMIERTEKKLAQDRNTPDN